mgnify:CR=1 FL=1
MFYDAKKWIPLLIIPALRIVTAPFMGDSYAVAANLILASIRDSGIAVLLLFYSVLKWRRCRYHLREYAGGSLHSLTLSQGVVLRRVLRVSAEDAASVEMERTPLLWLLGGRRLRINTAGLRRKSDAILYLSAAQAKNMMGNGISRKGANRYAARLWPVLVMSASSSNAALGLLALGALALGLSTDFFPWRILCSIRKPFSTFFMQIQFPWRFVGMAVPMLSAAAAWGYLREEKDAKTGMAALIALCVVFSGYTMQTMVQRLPELEKETYTDTRIGQFEYTYPCTEKTALKVGDVRTSQPGVCSVLSYEKRGTELTATVQLEGEAAYIELPLLYYPGYRAEIDGQAQTVARGTNNMVRVYGLSSGESGTVHVWYQPPTAWLIAQGASVLGALLLAASLRRMRRRA